jgi:hypothetical protein
MSFFGNRNTLNSFINEQSYNTTLYLWNLYTFCSNNNPENLHNRSNVCKHSQHNESYVNVIQPTNNKSLSSCYYPNLERKKKLEFSCLSILFFFFKLLVSCPANRV